MPAEACLEHLLVVVASELDDSSERIVNYLAEKHELSINVVFFNVFDVDGKHVVTRSWLTDPDEVDERRENRKPPWSGLYFVNIGMDHPADERPVRYWEHCRKFGYLSAGGAERWWRPLTKLILGDKVMAYVKKAGYVGFGEVARLAEPIDRFMLETGKTISEHFGEKQPQDADRWSYAVGIRWHKTFPIKQAKWFQGAFAKQPVVCRIKDSRTVEYLSKEFSVS